MTIKKKMNNNYFFRENKWPKFPPTSCLSFKKDSLSLCFEKFNRIINFDKINKTVTVEAGIKIYDFLNFTLQQNLWIPQIPGYPFITIGGAVASNVHGKSCGFHGSIRNLIKKITLFHRNHGWLKLSKEENKEIFDLTIGGFGLTGTIIDITFKYESTNVRQSRTYQ